MFLLVFLLAAPAEDVAARLRHLTSAAAAWAPSPSSDGTRVGFLTTLFGTRQAASLPVDGGFPTQLTDEPGGAVAVRYVPGEARRLIVTALRDGKRRLLVVDEDGSPPAPLDPAPGEQMLGGFSRDGKKLFYAVIDGDKVSLRVAALDTGKWLEVAPPPPAAGAKPPADFPVALSDALGGLVALGPPAPDARSILAVVKRDNGEVLVLVDLASARGAYLTALEVPAKVRQPRFTPDGKTAYLLTNAGRATMGVDAIALSGRARRTVYAPAQELDAFAVSEDGHRLAVAAVSNGEDVFSLLELPSLRAQPLAAPPAGALADAEAPLVWDRTGERLFFGWRQADDTTDVWELRFGYGAALRLTRSPRPGLPRDAIPRPQLVKGFWLWRPPDVAKPRVAVLLQADPARPVFDKRIAALNFAGMAVLAADGPDAQKKALAFIRDAPDLDARDPLLIDTDGLPVEEPAKWVGVVGPKGGLQLDRDTPNLEALVKFARRGGGA
ncbi:MAG TPA: hypothetical protein VLW85_13055 [Myxococcales bacterium]|nr:hypothetical protein [Myxococcales bacterium]